MKSLSNYIEEKLIINKDYKRPDVNNMILDVWNDPKFNGYKSKHKSIGAFDSFNEYIIEIMRMYMHTNFYYWDAARQIVFSKDINNKLKNNIELTGNYLQWHNFSDDSSKELTEKMFNLMNYINDNNVYDSIDVYVNADNMSLKFEISICILNKFIMGFVKDTNQNKNQENKFGAIILEIK